MTFATLTRSTSVSAALLLACLLPTSSGATTVVALTLDELTARAELIVRGWVTDIETERDPNSGGIYTWVTLEGVEVIHGTHLDDTLEVRLAGGQILGEREEVHGMPEFRVGEHVFLFLHGNGRAVCPIVGWEQGRLQIATDPQTGEDVLTDGRGNPLISAEPGARVLYGQAANGVSAGGGSAGVPDDPVQAAVQMSIAAPPAVRLHDLLATVDALRGVPAAAPAPSALPQVVDGIPVDASNRMSPAPTPLMPAGDHLPQTRPTAPNEEQ